MRCQDDCILSLWPCSSWLHGRWWHRGPTLFSTKHQDHSLNRFRSIFKKSQQTTTDMPRMNATLGCTYHWGPWWIAYTAGQLCSKAPRRNQSNTRLFLVSGFSTLQTTSCHTLWESTLCWVIVSLNNLMACLTCRFWWCEQCSSEKNLDAYCTCGNSEAEGSWLSCALYIADGPIIC